MDVNDPQEIIRSFWAQRACLATPEAARFHDEHTRYDRALLASLVKPGTRVLDLGCGTCVIANWLAEERGATVHGVDSQAAFLSRVATMPTLTTEEDDLATYRPEGQYDVVLLFGVINHMIEASVREALYARIADSLSPDAVLLIKSQFGVGGPVEVDTYSEALGAAYYSLYPGLEEETARLSHLFDVEVLDLYPPDLSPFANTHFHHLLGRKRA